MFRWLERYYERNDEKFMRIIRDSSHAEKYLAELYRQRITISIALFGFFVVWVLLMIILSSTDNAGAFLGMLLVLLINLLAIDSQIKMLQMINFMRSNLKLEDETSDGQGKHN
jgi:hypothetical protein